MKSRSRDGLAAKGLFEDVSLSLHFYIYPLLFKGVLVYLSLILLCVFHLIKERSDMTDPLLLSTSYL